MRFGSWTFPMDKIDIRLMGEKPGDGGNDTFVNVNDYMESREWELLMVHPSSVSVRSDSINPDVKYASLTYTISIRREPSFYIFVLIIPCILLSFLTLVVFWLPPEAPAKMLLGWQID